MISVEEVVCCVLVLENLGLLGKLSMMLSLYVGL